MNSPEKQYDIQSLFIRLLENDLNDEQREYLLAWSRSEPKAVQIYCEFFKAQAVISGKIASKIASHFEFEHGFSEDPEFDEALWELLLEQERTAPATVIEKPEKSPRVNNKLFLYTKIVSVAASVMALVFILNYIQFATPPALSVAVITDSIDAQWSQSEHPLDIGERLWNSESSLWLLKGTVKIAFDYGAEVIIEGPAEFKIDSSEKMTLQSGRLYAVVSKGGAGFTVQTPYSTVIDVGTEFGVKVDYDGSTDVHMFKGKALLIPGQKGDKSNGDELIAGQAKSVNTHSKMSDIKLLKEDFLLPNQFAIMSKADKGSAYHRWLHYSNELCKDPSLIAYYTFDNEQQSPAKLINCSKRTQGRLDGILQSNSMTKNLPTWVKGRWEGKGALRFQSQSQQSVSVAHDAVLNLDTEFTLAAWVLIGGPKDGGAILAKSDSATRQAPAPYNKNYQMCYFGAEPVAGGIKNPSSLQFSASMEAEFVPVTLQYGQWVFFVATYDAGTIRLYRDGRLVGESAMKRPMTVSNMPLLIGMNYPHLEYSPTYFDGLMDEIMIFDKALSLARINEIYTNGKQ